MRNRIWRLLCLALILNIVPWMVSAAGFIATVDNATISFGDSVTVKLRLEDAKALEGIDISPFAKDFMIYNQQQYSSYKSINGVVKSETGWNVTLMPKKEGEFIIPAITLETDQGRFSTQEIRVVVRHPTASDKSASDGIGISLVSIISKNKPYINEPIVYTLKIISYKPIANIVLDDIKSADAIVEKIGEPKQYNQTLGGMNAHVIEIRYAITALRPGKVTIEPAVLHGELQVLATQARRPQRYGLYNDMFMDNMIELKPFSLQSETIVLDAAPAAVASNNWLPLNGLKITEIFDVPDEVKVGDTITRKVKLTATGAFAKQLPSMQEFMAIPQLKVYANKPNFSDSINESASAVFGVREEEYSLVPQQAGTITLPEIKVAWYNLKTKKLETTRLPARNIRITAAPLVSSDPARMIDYSDAAQPQAIVTPSAGPSNRAAWIYVAIGVCSAMVLVGLIGILYLYAKRKLVTRGMKKAQQSSKHTAHITQITDVASLRAYVLLYATKKWQAPKNIALNTLSDYLSSNNYTYDIELYTDFYKNINEVLYAGASMDIEQLLQDWEAFRKTVAKNSANKSSATSNNTDYSILNPT